MLKFLFDLADDKMINDKKGGVSLSNEKEARRSAVAFARQPIETQP